MPRAGLTAAELPILESLWSRGRLSIREIQESFPAGEQPPYTTVQTTVYRLEEKGAVRRVRKIGNAHIFEAVISRKEARGSLVEDVIRMFGGRSQPVMQYLAESGRLTLDDIREAERLVKDLAAKEGDLP